MAAKFTQDENEWKAEAPILAGLPKESELEVPEGYFQSLQERVLAQVKEQAPDEAPEQTPEPKLGKPSKPIWGPYWTAAASLVLLAVLGFLVWRGLYANEKGNGLSDGDLMLAVGEELQGMDAEAVALALGGTNVSDDELFAALGSEAEGLYLAESQGWKSSAGTQELDDSDLDAINWEEVDIDLNNIY
jgi:hypothetical protein